MSAFPYTNYRAVNFRDIDPTLVDYSQSGKRVVRNIGGQKWTFTLSFPPMTKAQFKPVLGFVAALRGQYGTFTIIPPNLKTPLGTQTADTAVAANKAVGATSIDLSGGTVSATALSGDVIKFSNHDKVYMLTSDATFDGGGLATVAIKPPLVTAITTAHTVKHSSVPFTMALKGSEQEFSTGVYELYRYELDCEEAL